MHIRYAEDERAQLLLSSFKRLGPKVELLVLNGDIFDFCFGGSGHFRQKFSAFGAALQQLCQRGVRVVFIEGNHEFHLREIGWTGVEIITQRDFFATLRDGTSIIISHGDLLKDDPWYRAFRGLVKSRFARFVASFFPGRWIDAYALGHAKVSRSRDEYRSLDHKKVLACFDRWLEQSPANFGIIGHYHVPYAEPRRSSPGLMLCVESWDRPNFLLCVGKVNGQDAQFYRAYPVGNEQGFVIEKTAPLLIQGKSV